MGEHNLGVAGIRPGDVIAGKFEVDRVIGSGGMGYVVAARHLQLGQMVALKFMRAEVCTPDFKSRFLREARNTVRLKSRHVSRVLDVGALENGTPYMVMEYLEGADLSALLQKRGPLPAHEACEYILQACEAIAEAHGYGIVHRDLKPANLFLTKGQSGEPVLKVLDFGVSKLLDLGSDDDSGDPRRDRLDSVVTKATDILGSPSYMAPEQIVSARDADARSDVWSLGVILYRLMSGKPPFHAASLGELIQSIMHAPIPNLRDAKPDVPEGLEHVVARCLERDRAQRLGDVIELARLLAPYAGPVATPSLERIAILGPALVTLAAEANPSHEAGRSYGTTSRHARGSWTGPPIQIVAPKPSTPPKPKDITAKTAALWASVFVLFVTVTALAIAKIAGELRGPVGPPAATAQAAPVVDPLVLPTSSADGDRPSTTAVVVTTGTFHPAVISSASPTTPVISPSKPVHLPSSHLRPRPATSARAGDARPQAGPNPPPAPTSDIPATRE